MQKMRWQSTRICWARRQMKWRGRHGGLIFNFINVKVCRRKPQQTFLPFELGNAIVN